MSHHVLNSGVRVIADPMAGLRTLAISLVIRGGARWEDETRSGWSHLLEHMVFKGAGPRDARALVEAIEAGGGSLNAYTGYEYTSYQARVLEGQLPLALELLSDLVFAPTLDERELAREKGVIAQEIAEAFDTPDDHVFEMAQARAYEGQSLGRSILGTTASIGTAGRDDLNTWRGTLYAPAHMVLSVSGAVDEDDLLALAEARFGHAPEGQPDPALVPARFEGGVAADVRRIEQANLVFELPAPGLGDPRWHALKVLSEILGGGMASRLFQEVREKRGLAYAIDAFHQGYEDTGVLGIYAATSGADAAQLGTVVADELKRLADDGPMADEVARARAQVRAQAFMAAESPAARAERAGVQTLMMGAPESLDALGMALDAVDAPAVMALARDITQQGRAAVAALGPARARAGAESFMKALVA